MDTQKIHKRLLELLYKIDVICETEDLRYCIAGGTCLGAKRHGGFIPWDDDADIVMPREDYDRFKKIDVSKYFDDVEIQYYDNTVGCPIHYLKFIDTKSTLIERHYKNYVEGVYVDVFPLDGIGDINDKLEKIRWKKIWLLHGLIIQHYSTENETNIYRILHKKLARSIDGMFLHKKLEKVITKYSYNESEYIAAFMGAYAEREIMPKDFIGEPQKYKFEDIELFGPQKIDEYLSKLYGDYMRLPPENERVNKHNYYELRLDRPFKECE